MNNGRSSDDILKAILIFSSIVVVGILGWFIFNESKNAPTQQLSTDEAKTNDKSKKVADIGRTHITDISSVKYNSNPPTSGSHFAIWAKKGQYDKVISDGHLIHSLEHGYIVISYNCPSAGSGQAGENSATTSAAMDPSLSTFNTEVEETMAPFTPKTLDKGAVAVDAPESFQSEACTSWVNELTPFLKEADRMILVPRPNMDSKIALTAWGRIDTMNNVEADRIKAFIQNYHNQGPEKTIE